MAVLFRQTFDTLNDATETLDNTTSGNPLTNGGASAPGTTDAGTPAPGFTTLWSGAGLGPVQGGSDTSDFIGVNSFSGTGAPDRGPDGRAVTEAQQQNYRINDPDGVITLRFDPVDLSGYGNRILSFGVWISDLSIYEGTDRFDVVIRDGISQTELTWDAAALNAFASEDGGDWRQIGLDLEPFLGGFLSGDDSAVVVEMRVQTDGAVEDVFLDDVTLSGDRLQRFAQTFEMVQVAGADGLSISYNDRIGGPLAHDLVNNLDAQGNLAEPAVDQAADQPIDPNTQAIGFDASWRPVGGSTIGLTDQDRVGVHDPRFSGFGPVIEGDKVYAISDPDGVFVLTFDALDLSAVGAAELSLQYRLQAPRSGPTIESREFFEPDDAFRVFLVTDGVTRTLLDLDGDDIEAAGIVNTAQTLTASIAGATDAAQLIVEFASDRDSESVLIDNLVVQETAPDLSRFSIRSLNPAILTEGDPATETATFEIRRTGSGHRSETVTVTVDPGDLDASEFTSPLTQTLTFVPFQESATFGVTIADDSQREDRELFEVVLSDPSRGAALGTSRATGAVIDDDLGAGLAIYDIQGASHLSPLILDGQPAGSFLETLPSGTEALTGPRVQTSGIVTAVAADGFYLQDPVGDGRAGTSDALFVATGAAPTVAVGNELRVTGTVTEVFDAETVAGLSVTQLTAPEITLVSASEPLPEAVLLPNFIRPVPTETIDPDGFDTFITFDGLDFFESLEGMRVNLGDLLVVDPTAADGSLRAVLDGAPSTGLTARSTLLHSESDLNPEALRLAADNGLLPGFELPRADAGARLTATNASQSNWIASYRDGAYTFLPLDPVSVLVPSLNGQEVTAIAGGPDAITVATLALDGIDVISEDVSRVDAAGLAFVDDDLGDGRIAALGQQIAVNLGGPDIVALQEVLDDSGVEGSDGVTSAATTLAAIAAAIADAGGPTYSVIDTPDIVDGANPSYPGGNARSAILWNPDRVTLDPASIRVVDTDILAFTDAFSETAPPLYAEFGFAGERIGILSADLTDKTGSAPRDGRLQDVAARQGDEAVNAGVGTRTDQARALTFETLDLTGRDPNLNLFLLGNFEALDGSEPLQQLLGNARLSDLTTLISPGDAYTNVGETGAVLTDRIFFAGPSMSPIADAVHVNSDRADRSDRPTSHDPLITAVTVFDLPNPPVAVPDSYRLNAGQTLIVSATEGVLANDYDADGDSFAIVDATAPLNGEVQLNTDGSFIYNPRGFVGFESFSYQLADANGARSNRAFVTLETVAPPAVDVAVTAVAVSATRLLAGDDLTLEFSLTNLGPGAAETGGEVIALLSGDTTLDDGDAALATVSYGQLQPGGTEDGLFSRVSLPDFLPVGTYYLGVFAAPPARDPDSANNFSDAIEITVLPPPAPDLTVRNLALSSTDLAFGAPVAISWEVVNIGDAATTAPGENRLVISTDPVLDATDAGFSFDPLSAAGFGILGPGGVEAELTGNVVLSDLVPSGTYYVGILAEPVAGDADPTNNLSDAIQVTVAPAPVPMPDIAVENLILSTTEIVPGVPFSVSWEVANVGTDPASEGGRSFFVLSTDPILDLNDPGFPFESTLGDLFPELRPEDFRALGPGEREPEQDDDFTLPLGLPAGTYHVGVYAEPVPGDPDLANNFSAPLQITIGDGDDCDITGTPTGDLLVGTPMAETVCGLAGNDSIQGLSGDDTLDGGAGLDEVRYSDAGPGGVTVDLEAGTATGDGTGTDALLDIENVVGSAYDDFLSGDAARNILEGDDGEDKLVGGPEGDFLFGGDANDDLWAEIYRDEDGDRGDTTGINRLYGGDGQDFMIGGDGADQLYGGNDGDVMVGNAGDDLLIGGPGGDRIAYTYAMGGVTVDLRPDAGGFGRASGADGNDRIRDVEAVRGSQFDDTLRGDAGPNTLDGINGNDRLEGFDGNDRLLAGSGDDTLLGGAGDDLYDGGAGTDIAQIADAGFAPYDPALFDYSGVEVTDGVAVGMVLGPDGREELVGIEVIEVVNTGSSTFVLLDGLDPGAVLSTAEAGDRIYFAANDATVQITAADDAPLAVDDRAETNASAPIRIDVLANDFDPEAAPLSIVAVAGANATSGQTIALPSGAAVNVASNALQYDPLGRFAFLDRGEVASDHFSYTISDGSSEASAKVAVILAGPEGDFDTGTPFVLRFASAKGANRLSYDGEAYALAGAGVKGKPKFDDVDPVLGALGRLFNGVLVEAGEIDDQVLDTGDGPQVTASTVTGLVSIIGAGAPAAYGFQFENTLYASRFASVLNAFFTRLDENDVVATDPDDFRFDGGQDGSLRVFYDKTNAAFGLTEDGGQSQSRFTSLEPFVEAIADALGATQIRDGRFNDVAIAGGRVPNQIRANDDDVIIGGRSVSGRFTFRLEDNEDDEAQSAAELYKALFEAVDASDALGADWIHI